MSGGRPAAPAAAIFDLDGTLIGTKSLYLEAYRLAVRRYVAEEVSREEIMALRPTSELSLLRRLVAEADLAACLDDFYGAYERLHETHFEGTYPGVPEMLATLRAAGVPLGVVTGKSRRAWEITSAVVALGPFEVLVFDDDVRAPKPHPHGLELAIETLGCDPARTYYVGDSRSDVGAARAAGIRPVAALWARREEDRANFADEVRAEGALVAGRPEEVPELLGVPVP